MEYKVYIKSLNGIPTDDWGFTAYLGFRQRQLSIIFYEDIEEVPSSKYNIVVGHIEDTISFLKRLNIEIPKVLNIPQELLKYTKRDIEIMTMKQFKQQTKLPIFVKPESKLKEFVAGVITKESSRKDFFNDISDDSLVLTSSVIDIVSEYRGFVIEGELKSLQYYRGELDYYPDCKVIREAIKDFKSSPIAYSIDFGVTSSNETVLIECNDGWSLGSYGCESSIYVKLLLKRWLEMTK